MKQRALKDLTSIYYYQGYHSGRWENEADMDDSAKFYLKKMKEFANEWNIEYDDKLENYIYDEEEAECYTMDHMGYELFVLTVKKLLDIING